MTAEKRRNGEVFALKVLFGADTLQYPFFGENIEEDLLMPDRFSKAIIKPCEPLVLSSLAAHMIPAASFPIT